MFEFNERFMDEKEFNKFLPELTVFMEKFLEDVEFSIEFNSMICMGGTPSIVVNILNREDYDRLMKDGIFYNDEIREFEQNVQDKYGQFYIHFNRYKDQNIKEIELGDLVLIASEYGNDSIGVVTAVIEKDGKTIYGCSYLTMSYGSRSFERYPFTVSAENYGGYHEGFARKLNKNEAINILSKQAEVSYKDALKNMKEEYETSLKDMEKFIVFLGNERTINSKEERLKFQGYFGMGVNNSLIADD